MAKVIIQLMLVAQWGALSQKSQTWNQIIDLDNHKEAEALVITLYKELETGLS